MTRKQREAAQDHIVMHLAHAALAAQESGDIELAVNVETLAAQIARRYGLTNVPGLPSTLKK